MNGTSATEKLVYAMLVIGFVMGLITGMIVTVCVFGIVWAFA